MDLIERLSPRTALRGLFRQGFFHLLSANYLVQFLGFGTLLLIPRFVTPAELGEIKMIQTYAAFFLIVAGFGFNTSVLKLCAENRPDAEKAYFLKAALQRSLLATLGAFAAMAVLAFSGVLDATPRLAPWLLIYGLSLPFQMMALLMTAYLQARKRIKEMARAQTVIKLQSVVLVILATWQFGFEGFILSTVAAYLIGLWPFLRLIGLRFLRAARRPLPDLFMSMAVYGVLANGVHTLGKYADIYVLSLFHQDATEIGYYSLATIFLMGATTVTSTIQTIVMPHFSERAHDEAWVRRQLLRAQVQTALGSLGVAVLVHVGAWVVIHVLYDPGYLATLKYLDVLLLKYVLWSSFAVMGVTMLSLGLPRYNFYGALITTPVGWLFAYVLLQRMGTMGVAWAQVGTHVVMFVVIFVMTRLALRRHFRSAPSAPPDATREDA